MMPFPSHQKTDRAETAAILGILTFEILKVFDDIFLAVSGSADGGILTKLIKQTIIIIVVG